MENFGSLSIPQFQDLPDVVLYKVCKYLDCPFDLLSFGNTCSRLRKISSSPYFWTSLAWQYFSGLWSFKLISSTEDTPREWMLNIMRQMCSIPIETKQECIFSHGEKWIRVDTPKFRVLFYLLRLACIDDRESNPGIMYQRWLYDLGVYKREGEHFLYNIESPEFSEDIILQLSSLGQALERDLRRRRQPFKDPKYYVKKISKCHSLEWSSLLFPRINNDVLHTTCPLLLPFKDLGPKCHYLSFVFIISIVLEMHYKASYKNLASLPLKSFSDFVKVFSATLLSMLINKPPDGQLVTTTLQSVRIDILCLENILNSYNIRLNVKDIVKDIFNMVEEFPNYDLLLFHFQKYRRQELLTEIEKKLLSGINSDSYITRINLTDSELIGGDNYRQEMASAAIIADEGVLVIWHLVGATHY